MGVVTAAKARSALLRSMIRQRGRPAVPIKASDRMNLIAFVDDRRAAVGVVHALDEAARLHGISRASVGRIYYESRDSVRPILAKLRQVEADGDALRGLFKDFPVLESLAERLERALQDTGSEDVSPRELEGLASLFDGRAALRWARRYEKHPFSTAHEVQRAIDQHLGKHPLPKT